MKAKVIKRAYRSVIPQSVQTRLDIWRQDRFLKDMRINILKHFNENQFYSHLSTTVLHQGAIPHSETVASGPTEQNTPKPKKNIKTMYKDFG